MESASFWTAFHDEEEEAAADYRDADRKEVWYDALEDAQWRRGESLPSDEQRLQKRVAMRMYLLGEQPLDEWVTRLETLVWREIWLDNAYQALWWHTIRLTPWTAEHDLPEGDDYDGPGLLWDALEDDIDLGSTEGSRFWDIYDYRMGMYVWADECEVSKDMTHLVTREWELEQDYQHLLSFVQLQPTRQAEPDLIDWSWRDPQMAGGDGIEVSLLALQGCWAVGPDPQRQVTVQREELVTPSLQRQPNPPRGDRKPHTSADGTVVSAPKLQGAEGAVLPPQRQCDLLGIGSPVSIPQRQSIQQGIESPSPFPPQQDSVLGGETVGLPPQRREVCMGEEIVTTSPQRRIINVQGIESPVSIPQRQSVLMGEELVTTSPQRQLNVPGGDCKPHTCADGTVVSALPAQGVGTVGPAPPQQGCLAKGETVCLQQQSCVTKGETVGLQQQSGVTQGETVGLQQQSGVFKGETVGLQQPGSNQTTPVVVLATGQSTAGLCPLSNLPRQPTSPPHSRGEAPEPGQDSPSPRCSNCLLWVGCSAVSVLWVGCWTNKGTDRQEVKYPVSLGGKGEKCGETDLATCPWRGLIARLLPLDYGPDFMGM